MANDERNDRFTAEEEAVFDSDGFLAYNIVHTPSVAANLSRPSTDHAHLFDFPVDQAVRLCDSEDGGAVWMSRSALSTFEDTNGWAPRLHPVADGNVILTETRDETDQASPTSVPQTNIPQTSVPQEDTTQTNAPHATIPALLNVTSEINHGNLLDWMQAVAQSADPMAPPPAGFSWVNGRLIPVNMSVQTGTTGTITLVVPSQDATPTPSDNSSNGIPNFQGLQTRFIPPNGSTTIDLVHGNSQEFVQSAHPHQSLIGQSEVAQRLARPEPAGSTWRDGMLVPSSFNTLDVSTTLSSSAAFPPQHHQAVNQFGMIYPSSNQYGIRSNHVQGQLMIPNQQGHYRHPPPAHNGIDALMPPARPQQVHVDQGESHGAVGEPHTGSPRPNRRSRPAQSGTRRRRGNQTASVPTGGGAEGSARQGEGADEENLTPSAKKPKKPRRKSSSTRKGPATPKKRTPKKTRWQQHNEARMAQIKAGTAESDTALTRQDYANLVAAGGHREVTNTANFPLDHIFQYGQSPTAHLRRRRYDYAADENTADGDADEDPNGDEDEDGDQDDEFGGDEDAPGEDE